MVDSLPDTLLVISSAHDGYRRGGQAFGCGRNLVRTADFTADQLAQLMADPRLVVSAPDTLQFGAAPVSQPAPEPAPGLVETDPAPAGVTPAPQSTARARAKS